MQGVEHNGYEELTLLELELQLHSEFRRSLEPIRVTPLQAGVLPLSASSYGGQSDERSSLARHQAIDIECGGEGPGAQAVGHQGTGKVLIVRD